MGLLAGWDSKKLRESLGKSKNTPKTGVMGHADLAELRCPGHPPKKRSSLFHAGRVRNAGGIAGLVVDNLK
jgi:hypothetical protein